jgi:uncharacterized protein YqjF (DUF2071 family)
MSEGDRRVFLSAGWYNLLLFNYSVPPEVLKSYLPEGCELDLYDGSAHLSLVAFQFHNTSVLGIKWPGFTNFSEVNLRFYVKYNGERGVCFIREYVPSRLVSAIADWLYNEPYKFAKMSDSVTRDGNLLSAEYHLQDGASKMRFFARAENNPHMPGTGTLEHHFKEHELGVGRDKKGRTLTYRVHHPVWRIFPVVDYKIEVDAEGLYGKDFAFLSTDKPNSVVFAEGSEIKVFYKD